MVFKFLRPQTGYTVSLFSTRLKEGGFFWSEAKKIGNEPSIFAITKLLSK